MIRAATLEDIPQLLALGELMHGESPRFSRLRFSAAKLEHTLRALIGNPQGFAWVAVHGQGGPITGVLIAVAVEHWTSDDLVATDLALFVHPDYRGGRGFLHLVSRYREWARATGAVLRQLGVTTGVHSDATTAMLERIGMTRCGAILED